MHSRTAALACMFAVACASPPAADAGATPLAEFVGSYRGTLLIDGGAGRREVAMSLDVQPLGESGRELRWLIGYGDADRRDYRLLVDDVATGQCRIDERNGIELAARCLDRELVAVFATGGHTLVTRYRLVDDGVEFALESFAQQAGNATGAGVTTWPQVVLQRALLRRQ